MSMTETALAEFNEPAALIAGVRKYALLTVAVDGIAAVEEAHRQVKRLRIDIEKRRKALNEDALTHQRKINAEAKRLTTEIEPIEDALEKEKNAEALRKEQEKAAKEAAKQAVIQGRVERLAQAGCISSNIALLAAMDDSDFELHYQARVRQAQEEHAAREAARHEALRAEAERLAEIERQEAANAAERLRLDAERKQLAEQAAEEDRRVEEIALKNRQRLEAERRQIDAEREELRRQKQEIELQKETERRAEQQRLAAERAAEQQRIEAEQAAENERLRLARLEALKPEIMKAETFRSRMEVHAVEVLTALGNPSWGEVAMDNIISACEDVIFHVKGL